LLFLSSLLVISDFAFVVVVVVVVVVVGSIVLYLLCVWWTREMVQLCQAASQARNKGVMCQ
jgi:membrane protein DedA with SNARE-associated domain